MNTKIFLLCFFLGLTGVLHAQDDQWPRHCATDSMYREMLKLDPDAALRRPPIGGNKQRLLQLAQRSTSNDTVIFTIPIVFHVMHNYGSENISKDQILDAVDILNKSFQKLNDDTSDVIPLFQPIFANCQIRFRLANIDPAGNCTDGITRTQSIFTYSASDNVKTLIDWPNDKYLNVWVVSNIASGAAGYAYYPGASPTIDGVVIRHDYLGGIGTSNGSNYNERSLTHEVGHYLNLPHTWGSSNTPGVSSNCGIDDGISDTPNTIGTSNFSCNTSQSTCGFIDNVQNYMDYASCHKMFTEGQKMEMHDALIIYRTLLWDPINLTATGTEDGHVSQACTPIVDFSNKKISVCEGAQVLFSDASWRGAITGRKWYFQGGTPATDTTGKPVVTYSTGGDFDVTLVIYYGNDSSVLTRQSLVHVIPTNGPNYAPFTEGFESANLTSGDWIIDNPNSNSEWEITDTVASTGSKCIRLMNIKGGNTSGNVDAFITPPFNLSNITSAQASFRLAYAPKISSDASGLKVYSSTNCGASWTLRYSKSGSALMTTANPLFISWIPNASQWRTESIPLTPVNQFNGKPNVRFKFEFTNNSANNIFIDDINVTGVVGLTEVAAKLQFEAWPNPAHDRIQIRLERTQAEKVQWTLYDVTGRFIQQSQSSPSEAGLYESEITAPGQAGYYILHVQSGEQFFQYPIVFQ